MNQPHRVATLAVPVSATDHLVGPAHARVVVLEYGDFECPICIAVEPSVRQLRAVHPEMAFVFRHFPLEDAHPHALMAAVGLGGRRSAGEILAMYVSLLT